MKSYHDLINQVLTEGTWKNQRAVDKNGNALRTKSITGAMIKHDMRTGFPALTTKKVAFKTMAVELEGFIKGINSKSWYTERKCNIWNEWCNPKKVPYGKDVETLKKMREEDDLGILYGVLWNDFNGYTDTNGNYVKGINQLKVAHDKLLSDPTDRRIIVSAWNPAKLDECSLPACHYTFQFVSDGIHLDVVWIQRSLDILLGYSFDLASYALNLSLMAKSVGLIPRYVIGQFADVHIYENHMDQVKELLSRDYTKYKLPTLEIDDGVDYFNWTYEQVRLVNYESYPAIKAEVAI